MLNFKKAEKRFKQLDAQFVAGKLSEVEFKTQLEELMIQDKKGNWWAIGYETKQWYRFDGKEWIHANPYLKWTDYRVIAIFVIVIIIIGSWGVIYLIQSNLVSSEPGPVGPQGEIGPMGPAGPEGPAGPAGESADQICGECHNNNRIISGKHYAWSESLHGNGETTAYAGSRNSCAGCHSGEGFSDMIVARITPAEVETAYPNPSRIDCYTCHQIHVRYTSEDWTLTTTDPVIIYAFDDVTYDGGTGNICANCHQPRRQIEEANNGTIEVTSTNWGPHHGPNSTLLLGIGGAGEVEGSPSEHYSMVENTCVSCHLGENDDHSLEPNIVTCQGCHADAETYDINGLQTEIQAKLGELEEALIAMDMLESDGENRYPIPGTYQVTESQALWNYIFIGVEDSSFGVHNPTYTKALLDWSIDALNQRQ